MSEQNRRAKVFTELHATGDPLIIFNVWDAGTAKAAQEIGAKAIATGSYAVALANGFEDGEKLPLDLALANLERIIQSVELPVSLDFEGGYAREPEELGHNITKVIKAGAIGINFEDRVVEGEGLYSIDEQTARIRAIRKAADDLSVPIFINARTDIFLSLDRATHTESHLEEAINRGSAYAAAGASGFFAPGLVNPESIERLCKESPIPVNIMVSPGVPSSKQLADLGVARISYGGVSYVAAMEAFKNEGRKALEYGRIIQAASKSQLK
jgi:2-methylisocitrate lyase-like PEP mutase family enzyme